MATEKRRPKSANGDGGGRVRPNGTWEWRITLDDGRRLSAYGKTRNEAKLKCHEKAKRAVAGIDVRAAKQTLGVFLETWLADVVKPQLAPKTYVSYPDTVAKHITPTLGRVELAKLTPAQVQALLRAKENEKRYTPQQIAELVQSREQDSSFTPEELTEYSAGLALAPKLSSTTINYIRTGLRIALNRAVKWSLVERNVAALTDAPKKSRAEIVPLTPEQARVFLGAAEGDSLEALYLITALLGLRLGEGLGLRWQDVHLDSGTLCIRQVLQRVDGRLIFKEPKTEKSRRKLTLPVVAIDALRQHRDRQTFQAASTRVWRDQGLVFTNVKGGPLEPSNVLKRFKAVLKTAGLPEQRFQDLRHYAA